MNKKRLLTIMGGSNKTAWHSVFNGTSTAIDAGTETSIDTLSVAAVTLEFYLKVDTITGAHIVYESGNGSSGITIFVETGLLRAAVFAATTHATQDVSINLADSVWRHIAYTYDNTGDRKFRSFIDGSLAATSGAAVGDVLDDRGANKWFGTRNSSGLFLDGAFGWIRISNNIRYSAAFTPIARNKFPTVDANTVRLFKMNEGTGTTIIDYSANAQNATLANGTWVKA